MKARAILCIIVTFFCCFGCTENPADRETYSYFAEWQNETNYDLFPGGKRIMVYKQDVLPGQEPTKELLEDFGQTGGLSLHKTDFVDDWGFEHGNFDGDIWQDVKVSLKGQPFRFFTTKDGIYDAGNAPVAPSTAFSVDPVRR